MNKKGDEKYYIIISLILGIMVLALSLFFIFQEYFTEDEIDWEMCRQSIILRNNAPEFAVGGIDLKSTKDMVPLKCQTRVIEIDTTDRDEAEKIIADTMASCWYLIGNGRFKIFPSEAPWVGDGYSSPCMVCARISYSPEVGEYYSNNPIYIPSVLDEKIDGKTTYKQYFYNLEKSGDYDPFISLTNYGLDYSERRYTNMLWGDTFNYGITTEGRFSFPRFFRPERGDLYILTVVPAVSRERDKDDGDIFSTPYMFFVHEDIFNRVIKIKSGEVSIGFGDFKQKISDLQLCTSLETIPA